VRAFFAHNRGPLFLVGDRRNLLQVCCPDMIALSTGLLSKRGN
jgi:hypothetical protein